MANGFAMSRQPARDAFARIFRRRRPKVLARDGHRCKKCGRSGTVRLEVHHICGFTDNRMSRLITLCEYCHDVAPMGRAFFRWFRTGPNGHRARAWAVCRFVQRRLPSLTQDDMLHALQQVKL